MLISAEVFDDDSSVGIGSASMISASITSSSRTHAHGGCGGRILLILLS